jgi:cysteine-rich repeat protein
VLDGDGDSVASTDAQAEDGTQADQLDSAAGTDAAAGLEDATDTDATTADSADPDAGSGGDAADPDATTPECTTAQDCDDGNVCTDDNCTMVGLCDHATSTAACDDGQICTDNDTCGSSGCHGTPATCDDGEICTTDSCDPVAGCQYEALPLGATACSDDNVCTSTDGCFGGTCDGEPATCDDNNACTTDSCDPVLGCQYTANSSDCDDGVACTTADICKDKNCVGTPNNSLCTDDKPCTADTCGAAGCVFAADNSLTCDDASVCTDADHCDGGNCVGTAISCDDANPCTTDTCSANEGCDSTPLIGGQECQDGSVCTEFDACSDGKCQGVNFPCNDNNQCTTDSCDPVTGCIHLPVDGTPTCFDDKPCVTEDYCDNGVCIGGTGILACSDNDPCTSDGCDELWGCVFGPKTTGPCDDGNVCTTSDTCATGFCTGDSLDCDDGLTCTNDYCQPGIGCQHTEDSGVCQDGLDCTLNYCDPTLDCLVVVQCDDGMACTEDLCSSTGCAFPERAGFCTDGDLCTHDLCAAAGVFSADGCSYQAFTGACHDGDPCTVNEVCATGQCIGANSECNDANVCTVDSCKAGVGCVYLAVAVTTSCDDNSVCTTQDTCSDSACAGQPLDCSDGNTCTEDLCHPVDGCFYEESAAASVPGVVCDDGNPCTAGDTCSGQICAGPAATVCDDGISCSADFCDVALGGCTATFDPNNCNDGFACTIDDCTEVGCVHEVVDSSCDDGLACTDNKCDAQLGCSYPVLCDDGLSCTADSCASSGSCQFEANNSLCDDGNVCTTDTCVVETGCDYAANTATCTDGDACTVEACADKACVAGPATCDPAAPTCWQTCLFPSTAEVEPNGLCNNAAAPVAAPVTFVGALTPTGDEDLYAFTLASTSDLVIATYDSEGPYQATCSPSNIDTIIQLYSSDCISSITPPIDQGGVGNCSRMDAVNDSFVRGLAAGTYYVRVRTNSSETFAYSLDISTVAVCGNDKTEGSEECDGQQGCGDTCRILPVCNNGLTQSGEDCDDGNNDDGDGCSANCTWEKVTEVEPNNTPALSDTAGVAIVGSINIGGAIGVSNESDYFPLVTTVATVLQLEITDSSGKTCEAGAITAKMNLSLYDASGTALLASDTEAAGMGNCGALLVAVPAGSYYVLVKRATSGTVPGGYQLQVRYHTAATQETEPNESIVQATTVAGMRWVGLGSRTGTDMDYFATVTVTAGQSIRAEILEGGNTTCESLAAPLTLTLYNEAGTALALDTNNGRGNCAKMDGTGTSPDHVGASKLPAGKYYLGITGSSTFDYRLAVTIR